MPPYPWFLVALGVALLAILAAATRRKDVLTEIMLPVSASDVWAVLTDTGRYPEWNPFIIRSEGELIDGRRLKNTMRPEPGREMTFRPKVLAVRPARELRWLGHVGIPGLFDGEHYFLLREHGTQTQLIHGERFSGIAVWFIDVARFAENFEQMNRALESRLAECTARALPDEG